jgi:DNA-binding transcriptional MerR regulator
MSNTLSIGELVRRTGVTETTLRMWERRHGFPTPVRTPSGHRRYSEAQVGQVQQVTAGRQSGLSLSAAIERATVRRPQERLSTFATLRRALPELQPRLIGRQAMVALSHAVEDETLARAERQATFGCFQRERYYRRAQRRWHELSEDAVSAVFADFSAPANPAHDPAEIPIKDLPALAREWSIISYSEYTAIGLVGREPASSSANQPHDRRAFEALWTVEPLVVRDLARACADAAAVHVPEIGERAADILAHEPVAGPDERLRLATAVIDRTLSYLA